MLAASSASIGRVGRFGVPGVAHVQIAPSRSGAQQETASTPWPAISLTAATGCRTRELPLLVPPGSSKGPASWERIGRSQEAPGTDRGCRAQPPNGSKAVWKRVSDDLPCAAVGWSELV